MAGSSQYTAVLDANTLYPAPLRDLLLSLAVDGLYHARWTARIHEEWVRNLTRNRPELEAQLGALVEVMNRSVPDRLVENYEGLIAGLVLPDSDDRHVLAGVVVLFVQIGALSPETQYPCGFPAGATLAR